MAEDPKDTDTLEPLVAVQAQAIEKLTQTSLRVFATDPACGGNRDLLTKLLILRAETSALTRLCLDAGVFTYAQYVKMFVEETDELVREYAEADVDASLPSNTPTRGKVTLN